MPHLPLAHAVPAQSDADVHEVAQPAPVGEHLKGAQFTVAAETHCPVPLHRESGVKTPLAQDAGLHEVPVL